MRLERRPRDLTSTFSLYILDVGGGFKLESLHLGALSALGWKNEIGLPITDDCIATPTIGKKGIELLFKH